MTAFNVEVHRTLSTTFTIEAESTEEAKEQALAHAGDLSSEEFDENHNIHDEVALYTLEWELIEDID